MNPELIEAMNWLQRKLEECEDIRFSLTCAFSVDLIEHKSQALLGAGGTCYEALIDAYRMEKIARG